MARRSPNCFPELRFATTMIGFVASLILLLAVESYLLLKRRLSTRSHVATVLAPVLLFLAAVLVSAILVASWHTAAGTYFVAAIPQVFLITAWAARNAISAGRAIHERHVKLSQ